MQTVYLTVQTFPRAQGPGAGVRRLIVVGLIGTRADAANAWVRGRTRGEALIRGAGGQIWRPIGIDDLVAYLVGVLDERASYGQPERIRDALQQAGRWCSR